MTVEELLKDCLAKRIGYMNWNHNSNYAKYDVKWYYTDNSALVNDLGISICDWSRHIYKVVGNSDRDAILLSINGKYYYFTRFQSNTKWLEKGLKRGWKEVPKSFLNTSIEDR